MSSRHSSGWVKHFADGSVYIASDIEIQQRVKSWRNSRQDSIIQVDISHPDLGIATIRGTGEFWQEDDLMASFDLAKPVMGKLVARRIMKKIHEHDLAFRVTQSANTFSCDFLSYVTLGANSVNISKSNIDKWFVVEIDLEKGKFNYYIKE